MRPLIYTPGKKYSNTLIFSLDKIVRRKCSIIGRNLLKILPECFKLNHWHIERHTLHSKIEIKCCTIHKLKMCLYAEKKCHLKTIDTAIENSII
jgi:tRNA(Leu) C34 or U34 (ribose-2'-O)-methylase TrmL